MSDGRSNPPWAGRRAADALKRVKAIGRHESAPCVICDQSIDYDLTYPHPQSCSVQHVRSQKMFPELRWDPSNWMPAHLDCNKSEGTGQRSLGIGLTSQEW
ncbi:HNH endonuclease [Brevibacterium sp. Re57]|uniref:HNH endonuclease n=1 Tax=Brevibacterium gallinarum TaxID=2762220 RepID=A0ABR8WR60_9MICO|nr:HNH endonuclease [Brevibacterium gallinarum]